MHTTSKVLFFSLDRSIFIVVQWTATVRQLQARIDYIIISFIDNNKETPTNTDCLQPFHSHGHTYLLTVK